MYANTNKIPEPSDSGADTNLIQDSSISTNNKPKFNRFIRKPLPLQTSLEHKNDTDNKTTNSEKPTKMGNLPQMQCSKCNYKTTLLESLNQHMDMKHSKDVFLFDRLNFTYLGEVRIYRCDLCDYQAGRKKMLAHHILHNQEYDFQCSDCEYKTFSQASLDQHYTKHENALPSLKIASEAKSETKKITWSNRYLSRDKKIIASNRNKDYEDYRDDEYKEKEYKKYEDKKHIKNKANSSSESIVRCFHCNYKAFDVRSLLIHMKTHDVKNEPVYDSKRDYSMKTHTSDQLFYCDRCSFKTSSRTKLSDHFKIEHSSKKMFDCFQCDYKALDQNDIVKHYKQLHTKQNLFDRESTYLTQLKNKIYPASESKTPLSTHHDDRNLANEIFASSGRSYDDDDRIIDNEIKMSKFNQRDNSYLTKPEIKIPTPKQNIDTNVTLTETNIGLVYKAILSAIQHGLTNASQCNSKLTAIESRGDLNLTQQKSKMSMSANHDDTQLAQSESTISSQRDDIPRLYHENKVSRFHRDDNVNLAKRETTTSLSSLYHSNDTNITHTERKIDTSSKHDSQSHRTQRKRKLSPSSESDEDLYLSQRESRKSIPSKLYEERFNCFQCDFKAAYMDIVVKHIKKRHSNEKLDDSGDLDDVNNKIHDKHFKTFSQPEGKTFHCFQCDFKAATMSIVIEHIRRKHTN